MRKADRAVVLQAFRHGDKKYIVRLFTRHHGLLTAVATPGRSANSKIRSAVLQPLTVVDAQFIFRQNHDLHRLTEVSTVDARSPALSIVTLAIAQFLNEVMLKSLREPQPNEAVYDLVEYAAHRLNAGEDSPDFHLHFLKDLALLLGIEPRNNYGEQSPYFDCREGGFTPVSLSYPLGLSEADSALFSGFLSEEGRSRQYSRGERQLLLDAFIAYFRFHIPGFSELRSVAVVKEVLAG